MAAKRIEVDIGLAVSWRAIRHILDWNSHLNCPGGRQMHGCAENELRRNEGAAFTRFRRGWISASVFAALILVASKDAAHPQPKGPDAERLFDIPSQPLESALEAYGASSRLQVLYETALTAGQFSAEVKGMYTQEAALRRLLSGTGLSFEYTEDRSFTLLPPQSRASEGQPRTLADFQSFLGGVQASVLAALCRQPETRPGAFRLAMQFSVGGSGRLENPNLLSTTGMASRDAAIAGVLTRLAFSQTPPPGMPQPITMVLRAGPPDGDDECGGVKR
jgi:hypothetical protein